MPNIHQRHAMQLTYLAIGLGLILGASSFFIPLHHAWFVRGIILGMFVQLSFVWIMTRR